MSNITGGSGRSTEFVNALITSTRYKVGVYERKTGRTTSQSVCVSHGEWNDDVGFIPNSFNFFF